ncbi:MAG: hypothetical protein NC347_13290, partial [Clostridium sp.]|nr:hypothetical protein [Clostridium sp.]
DVTPEMKKLLDFIDGKEPEDDFTRELDEAVQSVRKNEKWRLDYMTLQMNYQEKYEQGIEEGRKEGSHTMVYSLVQKDRLTLTEGAEELNISIEQLKANMINLGYELPQE